MDPFLTTLNEMFVTTYRSLCKVEEVMLRHFSNDTLSISEMHTLESVAKRDCEGCTITDLAQDLDVTLPSVTMAVKRLEKKGYIRKERSVDDARRVRVALTESGRRAETAHRYFHRQLVRAVARDMPAAEREALLKGLHRINDFMRGQVVEHEHAGGYAE